MSFILDALKKSETDRQRQNGPALFEVTVAPPKTGAVLSAESVSPRSFRKRRKRIPQRL